MEKVKAAREKNKIVYRNDMTLNYYLAHMIVSNNYLIYCKYKWYKF